jgi:uncharacterized protein (TIGR01777 family)
MGRGRVIVSGATGFIGSALCRDLAENGYEVAVLIRTRDKAESLFGGTAAIAEWDGETSEGWLDLATGSLAVINLAGENIGARRWTKRRKQRLVRSRLSAGKAVTEAVEKAALKPRTIIQASAVGYYGSGGGESLNESSGAGEGFLAGLAREWEKSTEPVEKLGLRRIIIRSGPVLDRGGGFLPRVLRPFRLFVGGPLGSGLQWLSWIHRQDEIAAIRFLLEREDLAGVFNLTAPQPVTMREFSRTLGRVMKRPSLFRMPGWLLGLFFGEMARETLLGGQRVLPRALLDSGYEFLFPDVESALRESLLGRVK